jgi:hypothetical protein
MRTFGAMLFGGVAGIVILKLLAALLFPFLGFMMGLFGMAMKILIFGAIAYFVYTLIRGRRKREADAA